MSPIPAEQTLTQAQIEALQQQAMNPIYQTASDGIFKSPAVILQPITGVDSQIAPAETKAVPWAAILAVAAILFS